MIPSLRLAATLIVRFLLGDSTCTDSLATREQMMHARIVRLGWEDSTYALRGQQGTITFKYTANDSYAVRGWTTKAGRKSCELVRTLHAKVSVDVPEQPRRRRPGLKTFDLQGRRMDPKPSGRYYGRDSLVIH